MLLWLLLTLQVASSSFLDLNSNTFYVGDADNIMVSAVDLSLESLPHIQKRLKRRTFAKNLFPNHSALARV